MINIDMKGMIFEEALNARKKKKTFSYWIFIQLYYSDDFDELAGIDIKPECLHQKLFVVLMKRGTDKSSNRLCLIFPM